jgi:2-isopropylmalate synthase
MASSFNTRIAPGDRLRVLRQLEELAPDYLEVDLETYAALGGAGDAPAPRESRLSVFVRRAEDVPAQATVVSLALDFMPAHKESIAPQVAHLVSSGRTVLLIAENFFDAFGSNPHHAIEALAAARHAGAAVLILDDTRGGVLASRVALVCRAVLERVDAPLGIRARNDCGVAVANTLAAVECGFTWVCGAINGYGDRCGAADLGAVLADLELKLGREAVGHAALKRLCAVSHFVAEAANQPVAENAPYVGALAFGPELPASAAAVLESLSSVPHVEPEAIGRMPAIGASVEDDENSSGLRSVWLHGEGNDVELADGTMELLQRQARQPDFRGFEVVSWELSTRQSAGGAAVTTAAATLRVRDNIYTGTATGDGPIHALDLALLDCLMPLYPALARVRLVDYRVRVLQPRLGTASVGRVLIEWTDGASTWRTAGLSRNLLEASWEALADGMRLELMRLLDAQESPAVAMADSSWAV